MSRILKAVIACAAGGLLHLSLVGLALLVVSGIPGVSTAQAQTPAAHLEAQSSSTITEGAQYFFGVRVPADMLPQNNIEGVTLGVSGVTADDVTDANFPPFIRVTRTGSGYGAGAISFKDNNLIEGTKTVIITLLDDAGTTYSDDQYTVGSPASLTVTLQDNDSAMASIAATTATAVEDGTLTYTVTLDPGDKVLGKDIDVGYELTGTGITAADFERGLTGTVSVAMATRTGTLTLKTNDDSLVEGDEAFTVTLTAGGSRPYTLDATASSATGTITDNDFPAASITPSTATSATAVEGGALTYTIAVAASPVTAPVNVAYTLSGDGITAADFMSNSLTGTVPVTPGAMTPTTLTLKTFDDALIEGNETVTVTLNPGTGYSLTATPPSATGTITENDFPVVTLEAVATQAIEGDGQNFIYKIISTPAAKDPFSVGYVITGTGITDNDLRSSPIVGPVLLTDLVDVNAGAASVTLTATATDDNDVEGTEQFTITLIGGNGYNLGASPASLTATGTIFDNDTPGLAIIPTTTLAVTEEDMVGVTYTIALTSMPSVPVTVTVTASDDARVAPDGGAAVQSLDLTFIPTDYAAKNVTVTAVGDDDTVNDMATISHSVTSMDTDYAVANLPGVADITVTITDNALTLVPSVATVDTPPSISLALPDGSPDSTREALIVAPLPSAATPLVAGAMAVVYLPPNHGTGATATVVVTQAPLDSTGKVTPPATPPAGSPDPGLFVLQYTPSGVSVLDAGMATVCVPLATGESAAGASVYRSRDGATGWTKLSSAPPPTGVNPTGVVCGQTKKFSFFRLFFSKSLDAQARAGIASEWLGRFGRMLAESVVDTIADRVRDFRAGMAPQRTASIGGQQILLPDGEGNGGGATAAATATGFSDGLRSDQDMRRDGIGMDLTQLLTGSEFEITLGASGGSGSGSGMSGGAVTVYGGVTNGSFNASPASNLDLSGNALTGHLGADYSTGKWMFGLDFARSQGNGDYTLTVPGNVVRGDLTATMNMLNPYVAVRPSARLTAWASFGVGKGDMSISNKQGSDPVAKLSTDTVMMMASGGGVAQAWSRNKLSVDVKAEGFALNISSNARQDSNDATPDIAKSSTNVMQGRLGLVARGNNMSMGGGGGSVKPSAELVLRGDGGDIGNGIGAEIGGHLTMNIPNSGLTLDGGGHYVLFHSESGYSEWRLDMALSYDPGVKGQGMSLQLSPSYGVGQSVNADVWGRGADEMAALADTGQEGAKGLIAMKLGYGVLLNRPAPGRLEPWLGYEGPMALTGGGDAEQVLSLGMRYETPNRANLDLVTRQRFGAGDRGGRNAQEINLRASLKF